MRAHGRVCVCAQRDTGRPPEMAALAPAQRARFSFSRTRVQYCHRNFALSFRGMYRTTIVYQLKQALEFAAPDFSYMPILLCLGAALGATSVVEARPTDCTPAP